MVVRCFYPFTTFCVGSQEHPSPTSPPGMLHLGSAAVVRSYRLPAGADASCKGPGFLPPSNCRLAQAAPEVRSCYVCLVGRHTAGGSSSFGPAPASAEGLVAAEGSVRSGLVSYVPQGSWCNADSPGCIP